MPARSPGTALLGLLLAAVGGLASSSAFADLPWEISSESGAGGSRQGVVRQPASPDSKAGLAVLCDERMEGFLVLIDFPTHAQFEGEAHQLKTAIYIVADEELVHPDASRRSVSAIGQPASRRRVLRSDDATLVVGTLNAADRVELVAMPASYGAEPPRVAVDSRDFAAAFRSACPWLSENVGTMDVGAVR